MIHAYHITGTTCNNCVARVKGELSKPGGITTADAQLPWPQATTGMSRYISTAILHTAISKAGHYTISAVQDAAPRAEQPYITSVVVKDSYFPVFLILGFITGITLLVQIVKYSFSWMEWMRYFLAGFSRPFVFQTPPCKRYCRRGSYV
jgi:copper chaperone CopZ